MKNTFCAIIALVLLGIAGSAFAQASVPTGVTGRVIKPLTIEKWHDLAFGTFIGGATAGTVQVLDFGSALYGGGVTAYVNPGTITPARFHVTGEPLFSFANSHTAVTGLPVSPAGWSVTLDPGATRALDGAGVNNYNVLGTLNVPANPGSQTISGTFTESVVYN